MVIRLRMSFLNDGLYTIALNIENYVSVFQSFEKRSQNTSNDMVITMYQ